MMPVSKPARVLIGVGQQRPVRCICSWCRRDLGPLVYDSNHDSYGICSRCIQRYFAHLYEPGVAAPDGTAERSVGK